ncbi:MAG TPA: A24 family peptidase [Abditibacteriaceae bacterium]|nr:A24 family peptidase [Abditibacteriaceae bacterium]
MSYYFSVWNGAQIVGAAGSLVINAVLLLAILTCAYTDTKTGKILNKITFPAMLAGIILNTAFGVMSGAGLNGLWWSLIGLCVGMAIQWVPYLLSFAKAGDVKLLMAVGALKGWAFCSFGFLFGAAAFGFLLVPWLAKRGELRGVTSNIKNYFAFAAITQSVPDAPAPTTTRRYVPWGMGLVIGFLIALAMELLTGRVLWLR